jgi:hypothetical protein
VGACTVGMVAWALAEGSMVVDLGVWDMAGGLVEVSECL